jgi:putative tryptophan/tyrosine transport system substrate-binding protein
MIGRREFITLLGGAAAWPLAARAQQAGKLPTIGFLGTATPLTMNSRVAAFVQRLRELGWIENRTVAIEYRWAEGRSERFAEIVAEFVRLKVDVIVTGGDAAGAAKQATPEIPIVFALGLDPLGSGLVANLARPGGNATGISFQSVDIAGKRVELLHEIVPHLRRLAILANVGNPQSVLEMGAAQAAARMLGLEVATFEFRRSDRGYRAPLRRAQWSSGRNLCLWRRARISQAEQCKGLRHRHRPHPQADTQAMMGDVSV